MYWDGYVKNLEAKGLVVVVLYLTMIGHTLYGNAPFMGILLDIILSCTLITATLTRQCDG